MRAMIGLAGKALALSWAGAVGLVIASTACLGSLPEPVECPPAPVYASSCQIPGGIMAPDASPQPPVGTGGVPPPGAIQQQDACGLERLACIKEQGRACACSTATECKRTATTCSPAPDCPRSIRAVASTATCLETSASFSVLPPPCVCGCASCAAFCDGQGPILAGRQTIRFDLPGNLPASGQLRVMARLRGQGMVGLAIHGFDGSGQPFGQTVAGAEFAEQVLDRPMGPFTWSTADARPSFLELVSLSDNLVEVDCVVPFLVR